MRALKSLSSPLLSKCNRATLLHRSVFGLKGRAFPKFKYILSHNLALVSSIFSRIVEKELQGIPRGPARGCQVFFAWICPNFPKLFQVCPI